MGKGFVRHFKAPRQSTSVLTTITRPHIIICIPVKGGPKEATMKDLVSCPYGTMVAPSLQTMKVLKNGTYLLILPTTLNKWSS